MYWRRSTAAFKAAAQRGPFPASREVEPLQQNIAMLIALSCLLACGEFHTQKYYGDISKADVFDSSQCDVWYEAKLAGVTSVRLREHEPAALRVYELALPGDLELRFSVPPGSLPAGLQLDVYKGTISGFPSEAGIFAVELRVAALLPLAEGETEQKEDPCVRISTFTLELEVLPGCKSEVDCPGELDFTPSCVPPGRCVWSTPAGGCPSDQGEVIKFDLSDAPESLTEELFEVLAHHQLTAEEQTFPGLAGYSHQLLFGGPDGALWTLPYHLVDRWPLPFAPGEQARMIHDMLAPYRLTILTPSGDPAALLYGGPLPEFGSHLQEEGDLDVSVRRAHLDCLAEEGSHQCDPARQDLLLFSTASGPAEVALGSGEGAPWSIGEQPFQLNVATAYTDLPDKSGCRLFPTWAAFEAFPLATCPIAVARMTTEPPVVLRPEDESISVNLNGADSFAHLGGELLNYEWTLENQPFAGLTALTNPSAGKGTIKAFWTSLPASAAGTYNVLLHVADLDGQRSCVAALSQVRVLAAPEIDLRVELVWWNDNDELALNADLDLLLMHPTFAAVLGDQVWQDEAWEGPGGSKWVCSEKNPNPANWAALPVEEGTLCRVAPGALAEGRPEVATVARIDRDKKTNRYPLAVRAPLDNPGIIFAGIRVFVQGVPKYETTRQPLLPGQLWQAGHVDVEFMKFVPHKNGK